METSTTSQPPQSKQPAAAAMGSLSFPRKLYNMLQDAESKNFEDIVAWQPGGKSFQIYDALTFEGSIMPTYFSTTTNTTTANNHASKFKSFQRQLNIYGFRKVPFGPNKGGMTNKNFIRHQPELLLQVIRKDNRSGGGHAGSGGAGISPKPHNNSMLKRRDVLSSSQPPHPALQMPQWVPPPSAAAAAAAAVSSQQQQHQHPQHPHELAAAAVVAPPPPIPHGAVAVAVAQAQASNSHKNNHNSRHKVLHSIDLQDSEVEAFYELFYPDGEQQLQEDYRNPPPSHVLQAILQDDDDEDSSSSSSDDDPDGDPPSVASVASNDKAAEFTSAQLDDFASADLEDFFVTMLEDEDDSEEQPSRKPVARSLAAVQEEEELGLDETSFPFKLHLMLEQAVAHNYAHIVSWVNDGTAFKVYNHDAFVEQVLPNYFDQSKYESFRRQLNLYGFARISRGADRGVISHPFLVAGDRTKCRLLKRKYNGAATATAAAIGGAGGGGVPI